MKRFSILLASLALAFTASSAGVNTPNAKQAHAATGDEHKLVFKGDYRERNYAESAAGWWGNGYSFNDGVATITTTNAAYFANGATVAGETYVISYDVKTVGSADILFNINTPSWKNIQKEKNKNYTDYVHYDLIYTAEASSDFTVYFAITGTIQVKNLYIHNSSSVTVKEGEVITNLPDIVPVEGKKSYWAIDGKEVKNGDVYNYSSDKVVTAVYEDPYSITFHNGGLADLSSDEKYYYSATGLVSREDGALHLQNNDGKAEKHTYVFTDTYIANFVAGKTYKLSLDIKCDNVYLVIATNSPWIALSAKWTNIADFTTKEFEFTPTKNGANAAIIIRINTVGNAYVKNIRLYEVETVECQKDFAIGTLPEIKKLNEFDEASWQIDGTIITSETIFNYSTASKNAYVKYEFYNAAKFTQEWIELRLMEGGFCAVLVDGSPSQAKYNELLRKYNSLSAADREIVNNTTDSGDATILDSMKYIENLQKVNNILDANNATNPNGLLNNTAESSNVSAIVLISLLALTSILGYAFISKRKRA